MGVFDGCVSTYILSFDVYSLLLDDLVLPIGRICQSLLDMSAVCVVPQASLLDGVLELWSSLVDYPLDL